MSQIYKASTGGGAGTVETLTGNTGGAVGPTGNNINVIGTGSITVTGDPGTSTLTISSSGGGGITTIDGDTGSVTGSTVTIETLPATNGGTAKFTGSGTTLILTASDSNSSTGFGFQSLNSSTSSGTNNSAFGTQALRVNTTGANNTAIGSVALAANLGGSGNNAFGNFSLSANTTGSFNTGFGYAALLDNLSGSNNIGVGTAALQTCTNSSNTAIGYFSLNTLIGGSQNIAIGYQSGLNYLGSESDNICIGAKGIASESNKTRIGFIGGSPSQTGCFIDGINSANSSGFTTPLPVYVDSSTGQLGFGASFSGITTIDGDTGSATGSTITLNANTNSGSSVKFVAATATVDLEVTDSIFNTIIGSGAGNGSITGAQNVGLGRFALSSLTNGTSNVTVGNNGLKLVTSGGHNVNVGSGLAALTTGASNVAVGDTVSGVGSGSNYTSSESSNIVIANAGVIGESNVIRIGTQGILAGQQSTCYIAGIEGAIYSAGSPTPALSYCDTSDGQLVATPAVASSTATSSFGSLVVGTALQNTANYAILVNVSMAITAATGATIVLGVGSTSTPTTNTVVASFSIAETISFSAFVPAGYFMLVNTTGTIVVGSITTQTCAVG